MTTTDAGLGMTIVEQNAGRGRLQGDGLNIRVSYFYRVTEETNPTSRQGDPSAAVPGLQSVDGSLVFEEASDASACFGKRMTLQLEDGRRLTVLVVGPNSFKASGGFF